MDQEYQGSPTDPAVVTEDPPAPVAPVTPPAFMAMDRDVAPGPGVASPPAPSKEPTRTTPRLLVIVLVAALVGGGVGAGVTKAFNSSGTSTVKEVAPGPALAGGASIPAIVQKVLPEVVTIDATGPSTSFLGGSSTQQDQGTGMLVTSTGEVLTNNHVIAGATSITVTLYHQTTALSAKLVGADPSSDVALIKIDSPPKDLQTVAFGDSTQLQVGDAVIAVGNALGLSAGTPTVTSGIVSATGRSVQADDSGDGNTENLPNMIQTDAAINSGNSGGPLVDSAGQVVGMNTAVASSGTGNAPAQNIGFAIPSSTIEGLLAQLRNGGTSASSGGYLGVEVADMTAQIQQEYGLDPSSGALVAAVVPGSPAESVGLQVGDVIVAFNGRAVSSAQDVLSDVQRSSPGAKVALQVWRGNQKLTLTTTLAQPPAS